KIAIAKVAAKPWFVPDTTTLQDQLNALRRRKSHFALAADEYGEVEGLATPGDLLEEIVGEISARHDNAMHDVKQQPDGAVVDEYGEVEGLVTLEDVLEEIVGEISGEHDIDMQGVKQEADGSVVVDGSVPIRELNPALDWHLPDDEATPIAGLVIHEAQTIP